MPTAHRIPGELVPTVDARWQARWRNKNDETSKEKCKQLENVLAESCASEYAGKLENETKNIDCTKGGYNSRSLWTLKKKMFSKSRDPPTAMLAKNGLLQMDEDTLKEVAKDAYIKRLENRKIKSGLEELQEQTFFVVVKNNFRKHKEM